METQEQEVEAFKKWWKDNGKVVVAGIVFGLGGVIGWNWWQSQEQGEAEQASAMYAEVVNAANGSRHEQALAQAKELLQQHPGSGYAALAALVGARSAYTAKLTDEAVGQLQWVIENATPAPVKDLARLRLARVLRSEGKFEEAQSQLAAVQAEAFRPIIEELKGDIASSRKDSPAAVQAYQSALAAADIDANSRQRIEIKLSDLGVAPSAK